MERFEESIADIDVMVNMNDLVHTNFTGHPSVVMPFNFRDRGDAKFVRPAVLTGHLHDDERLLSIASAFQSQIDTHHQHPNMDLWLEKFNDGTLDNPKKSEKKKEPTTEQKEDSGDSEGEKPSKDGK